MLQKLRVGRIRTLVQVALQYLGDASRWVEIAALNELIAPYIDEVGQNRPLSANGAGNQIAVSDGNGLLIDHLISISSNNRLGEQRRILDIEQVSSTYWSLTISGPADLNKFRLADNAKIHFTLPNTVNSQKVIFIPSDQSTTNNDVQLQFVPTLSDLESILQVGGVDGALTSSGDIAIDKNGNWPYVTGMQNLIQYARVALNTPVGSWLLVPNFGIDNQIGQSLADLSAQDILASLKNSFALNNAFTGIRSALIQTTGPATTVTIELGIKGTDSTLPVSFEVAQ